MRRRGEASIKKPAVAEANVTVVRSARDHRDRLSAALFARLARAEDAKDRRGLCGEIVELHMDIARGIAWRYRGRGEPLEDLQQVACLGLVHAVARFDPGHGTPFQVFAAPTISGEVKKYFRDRAWTIRPPRRMQELQAQIADVRPALQHRLHSAPTARQLAEALQEPEKEVIEALSVEKYFAPDSLDAPVGGVDPTVFAARELVGALDPGFTRMEASLMVHKACAQLDGDDRQLLELRFFHELSQREISEQVGVSQMAVSRALDRILSRMREQLQS